MHRAAFTNTFTARLAAPARAPRALSPLRPMSPLHPITPSRSPRRARFRASAAGARAAVDGLRFADVLGGAVVEPTGDAPAVALADAIATRGTVTLVGWLRHYGCTLCKKQASDWKRLSQDLPPNTAVMLVGCGTRAQAADFAEELAWPPADLYSDPSRTSYAALQFAKGVGSLITRDSLFKTIASFREGNKQSWSRMPTDPFQQGGALVVDAAGYARFCHRDAAAGDHAALDVLADAVRDAHAPLHAPVQ